MAKKKAGLTFNSIGLKVAKKKYLKAVTQTALDLSNYLVPLENRRLDKGLNLQDSQMKEYSEEYKPTRRKHRRKVKPTNLKLTGHLRKSRKTKLRYDKGKKEWLVLMVFEGRKRNTDLARILQKKYNAFGVSVKDKKKVYAFIKRQMKKNLA